MARLVHATCHTVTCNTKLWAAIKATSDTAKQVGPVSCYRRHPALPMSPLVLKPPLKPHRSWMINLQDDEFDGIATQLTGASPVFKYCLSG
jgi:hypothetical protein